MNDTNTGSTPSLSDLMTTLPGKLDNLASGVTSAYGRAADFAKTAASLPQQLKDAIMKKFNDNQDLITSKNQALQDYYTAPSQARVDYSNILDPTQREALVANAREIAATKARSLTDLLTQRGANINDIVGNVSNLFGGETNAAQLVAQGAQSAFSNALGVANLQTGLASTIESNAQTKKQQDFSNLFSTLQLTGGDIQLNGKTYHIPGYEEQLQIQKRITGGGPTAAQAAQQARDTVQNMAKGGANLDNVMSTGITMGLDPNDILNIYNGASIYGPAVQPGKAGTATDKELERKYGISRGELAKTSNTSLADEFAAAWKQSQNNTVSGSGTINQ